MSNKDNASGNSLENTRSKKIKEEVTKTTYLSDLAMNFSEASEAKEIDIEDLNEKEDKNASDNYSIER